MNLDGEFTHLSALESTANTKSLLQNSKQLENLSILSQLELNSGTAPSGFHLNTHQR